MSEPESSPFRSSFAQVWFWIWGAITVAFWFLAFSTLGGMVGIPNAFLAGAIISTLGFLVWMLSITISALE